MSLKAHRDLGQIQILPKKIASLCRWKVYYSSKGKKKDLAKVHLGKEFIILNYKSMILQTVARAMSCWWSVRNKEFALERKSTFPLSAAYFSWYCIFKGRLSDEEGSGLICALWHMQLSLPRTDSSNNPGTNDMFEWFLKASLFYPLNQSNIWTY